MKTGVEHVAAEPHILIVSGEPAIPQRLGRAFKVLGITYEVVKTGAEPAIARIGDGEPPVTGVVTEALRGDYPAVLDAAKEAGANVVLLTSSSLLMAEVAREGVAAYLMGQLSGRVREGNDAVPSLIENIAPGVIAGQTRGNYSNLKA